MSCGAPSRKFPALESGRANELRHGPVPFQPGENANFPDMQTYGSW